MAVELGCRVWSSVEKKTELGKVEEGELCVTVKMESVVKEDAARRRTQPEMSWCLVFDNVNSPE